MLGWDAGRRYGLGQALEADGHLDLFQEGLPAGEAAGEGEGGPVVYQGAQGDKIQGKGSGTIRRKGDGLDLAGFPGQEQAAGSKGRVQGNMAGLGVLAMKAQQGPMVAPKGDGFLQHGQRTSIGRAA